MILIDTIFINNGGGKILLDYLYDVLGAIPKHKIIMLIDHRIKSEYSLKKDRHIEFIFLKGLVERNNFYKKNATKFNTILCFGNIPPNIRTDAKVYTYFHQPMYLNIPKEFSTLEKIKFKLKIFILNSYKNNTDFWLVQSQFIKDELQKKFKLPEKAVKKLPFYPPFKDEKTYQRIPNTFLYVSNANPHKNHFRLIDAFCQYYNQQKKGELTLTVNDTFPEVVKYIEKKVKEGYPINNIGFIYREDLYRYYHTHEYLIFPSLAESYGLGIIEAIENGCKVLGADLPYMHEICVPTLSFDPLQTNEIFKCLMKTGEADNLPFSKPKTRNQIDELIKLLTSNEN